MALGKTPSKNKRKKSSSLPLPIYIAGGAGVVVFILAVGLALHFMRAPSEAAVQPAPQAIQVFTNEILVPIDTIQVGVELQPNLFRKEAKPEGQVTGDMIRSLEELKGMYSRGVLFKGQPILKAALSNRQPVHVLTALVPKDHRAVAIEVERPLLDNVDGWAQPGTDVDLVWITSALGREMASVLAGPVRILASNKSTEWSPAKPANAPPDKMVTLTLLLSARDATRVTLAAMHGKISLGLRGLNDKRPIYSSHPLSTVVEERVVQKSSKQFLSVKVIDPDSNETELRKYDYAGRRITD